MQVVPSVEFSRLVTFDEIGVNGATYQIEAREDECRLLAARFNLVAIHNLKASFAVSHGTEPGSYVVEGEIEGEVVQSCVSTLKDVQAHVQANFYILLRPSQEENQDEEFIIDLDDERDIEYYTQESIDLGETAAQYLYLNLDPFPHAPDAPEFLEEPLEIQRNPLAEALKGLKKDK
ncbi:MAG: YceD family protein [Candidatus Paracaedibacter sp.]